MSEYGVMYRLQGRLGREWEVVVEGDGWWSLEWRVSSSDAADGVEVVVVVTTMMGS